MIFCRPGSIPGFFAGVSQYIRGGAQYSRSQSEEVSFASRESIMQIVAEMHRVITTGNPINEL